MKILLPPSETKHEGGDGSPLDLDSLVLPSLNERRSAVLEALIDLAADEEAARRVLKLSEGQRGDIAHNRALRSSPTMPAIDRYTGVLFDGLDAERLPVPARRFAAEHVVIHSALFGIVRADDPIPAYRLSHDSRLPGASLRSVWRAPVSAVLAAQSGLVLDLRSESYAALGPAGPASTYLRVVSEDARGRRVALSHFNKKAKGEFTRALLIAGIDHGSADDLVVWARTAGWRLEAGAAGELDLVV